MNELFSKSWRSLALRGVISLVFGILAALWPGITLLWLLIMFAAYALIQGGGIRCGSIPKPENPS